MFVNQQEVATKQQKSVWNKVFAWCNEFVSLRLQIACNFQSEENSKEKTILYWLNNIYKHKKTKLLN